jgi:hypothetical protein
MKGNANSHLILDGKAGQPTVRVQATTLEDLAEKLPAPTLVKIDVEGAELGIFNAGDSLLKKKEVTFLVELHPWAYPEYKSDFERLLSKLDAYGRKVSLLDDRKKPADLPFYGSIIF